VSPLDFQFSMSFTGRDEFGPVVTDVAANVFQQAGCAPAAVAELVKDLESAVVPCASRDNHVDVRFRAGDGSCEVIVSVDDREIWRTSRRIP